VTTQSGYRVPNWLVALAGAVIFLVGIGIGVGRQLERVSDQHQFLIYETCRIERQLGMLPPRECGNHIPGEGQ
jgi:hypothetical protein